MALTPFSPPTYQQILQALLNDYIAVTSLNGFNLSVTPGSEPYLRLSTVAAQQAVLYQMMVVLTNSKLIDTATGSDLDRVANDFGLQRRSATNAIGFVQLVSSVPQTIAQGATLTGPNSLSYQVSQSGVYNPNANVPIISIDQGGQTNIPIGSIMSWGSVLPNMQSTCLVSVAVTGGVNAEDDNTLRNRLYLTLQSPQAAFNTQNMITMAGSLDSVIQQAFVYSNFNGAGTQLVALTGYQTSSYVGRDIPHFLQDGYVKPYGVLQIQPGLVLQPGGYGAYNQYTLDNPGPNLSSDTSAIYGQLPGPIANPYATVVTTVNNVPSDIAAVLTLPYPVGASTNGFGNGWNNFVPWPCPDGYYVPEGYCSVVSVQGNGTVIGGQTGFGITVSAPSSGAVHTNPPFVSALTYSNNTPTPGTTQIQWINRSDYQDTGWLPVTATVLGATDNGNDTWSIVLNTPLVFGTNGTDFYGNTQVAVGDFIFPACSNAQNYLTNVLVQYALLGPGQVTNVSGLIALGASRFPSSNTQFPAVMGISVERYLVTQNPEVYSASVNSSNYTGNAPNLSQAYNSAFTAPAITSPPNIYVPRNLGFYPTEFFNFGVV